MARNYAALPHDYIEELELLTDEQFGRICRALLRYSRDKEETTLDGVERLVFPRVKLQEDRFQASYDEVTSKRREAGKNGASKRWDGKNSNAIANDGFAMDAMANDGKAKQAIAKHGYTETNTETNIPLPSEGGSVKRKKFAPPTLEEVAAYVAQRGSCVDPQAFIDFYEAKGWVVGKTPMKDWKAACRNAESWDRWKKKPSQHSGNVFMEMLNEEGGI